LNAWIARELLECGSPAALFLFSHSLVIRNSSFCHFLLSLFRSPLRLRPDEVGPVAMLDRNDSIQRRVRRERSFIES
jgi:hypothetical protein